MGISSAKVGDYPARGRSELRKPPIGELLGAILTTSVCVHLLAAGFLGFGVPAEPQRAALAAHPAPPAPAVIENVQLAPPAPPPPAARDPQRDQSSPAPAADLLAPAAAISAVSPAVNVAFAIRAVGAVHLVSDAAEAGGAVLGSAVLVPQEVTGRSLLVPALNYPAQALARRLTGKAIVEFHTTSRGDIVDPRIRVSSGSPILDRAALENLRPGRWAGEAGYFTKTYEFVLR